MTMLTLYQLRCDANDCGRVSPSAVDQGSAREAARRLDWAVGPWRKGTRRGSFIFNTDYCWEHAALAEGEPCHRG